MTLEEAIKAELSKGIHAQLTDIVNKTYQKGYEKAMAELIHCKDCKFSKAYYHGTESNLGMFTYLCTQGLYGMNADDYCSRARRRDE